MPLIRPARLTETSLDEHDGRAPTHVTKRRLIDAGLRLLLERGYSNLGIQAILEATGTPKGSFYHHFRDKEDFAFQVVDAYMEEVHAGLDFCLGDLERAPLDRVRHFFELTQEKYRQEGYMGCLLGGLGQELAAVSEAFRNRIDKCLTYISERMAICLAEAPPRGDIPAACDTAALADRLVDCWEGAALRSRLRRDPDCLGAMLDFYLCSVAAGVSPRTQGQGACP